VHIADERPLGSAVEEGLASLLILYARAAGGTVRRERDIQLAQTGLPIRILNAALLAALRPAEVDMRIAATIDVFALTGLPWRWIVGPRSQPADLADRLAAAGLVRISRNPAMALDLIEFDPRSHVAPDLLGFRLQEVSGEDDLQGWLTAQDQALGLTDASARAWRTIHLRLGFGSSCPLRNFVAWLGGRPVGAATLYVSDGFAGIYNVGTVPDARGHGIGRAVTAAALRAGQARGVGTAILSSSPLGLPVYRQLGFSEVGHIASYVTPDQAAEA